MKPVYQFGANEKKSWIPNVLPFCTGVFMFAGIAWKQGGITKELVCAFLFFGIISFLMKVMGPLSTLQLFDDKLFYQELFTKKEVLYSDINRMARERMDVGHHRERLVVFVFYDDMGNVLIKIPTFVFKEREDQVQFVQWLQTKQQNLSLDEFCSNLANGTNTDPSVTDASLKKMGAIFRNSIIGFVLVFFLIPFLILFSQSR